MIRIGLCGGSGSGKSVVSAVFARHGVAVLDTDALYHTMISRPSPVVQDLCSVFGPTIKDQNGAIDRKKLRDFVFDPAHPDRIPTLNRIVHPHVCRACRTWADERQREGAWAICYDAPLLFESGLDRDCQITVGVVSDRELRLARIIKRDAVSRQAAERRIDSQTSDERLRELCDHIIRNDGTIAQLKTEAENLILQIKAGAEL